MNKRLVTLIVALIVTLCITAAATAQSTWNGTRWEYGQVFYNRDVTLAFVPDDSEREAINAEFDALPDEQKGAYGMFQIMGSWGWEMIQIVVDPTISTVYFKREVSNG